VKEQPLKTIKWGIIGLGGIANKFASDLAIVENATLVAVASRTQENANEFAEKFSAKKAYNSYEALAKDTEVDAVYIATPHSFHKEHAILCLQNKKAVLCEKPFAMNLQEVEEMITVAKQHKVLLMEGLWTYFLPHYQYVLELIKKNFVGNILRLEADFGFHAPYNTESRLFKKDLGGGSLFDIGIYPIFAALSTLGEPEHIDANATFFKNGVDADCNMVFQYKKAKAILKSTLLKETKTEAIFTCTHGNIKINRQFHGPSSVTVIQNGEEITQEFVSKGLGYYHEIIHFNQLLREDKTESDVMTFAFSKKLLKIVDSVRKIIDLEY
jgi:predicted dehydrogenase